MSANPLPIPEAADMEALACSAPFVFLLVAAADGKVEQREIESFSQAMGQPQFAIVAAVMARTGYTVEQAMAAAQRRLDSPAAQLGRLAEAIDDALDPHLAWHYKRALYGIVLRVAESSGGWLSRMTRKVGKTESAMLTLIATAFGLVDDNGDPTDAPPRRAAAGPDGAADGRVLTDALFPALKPAQWAESAREHVAMRPLLARGEGAPSDPVVGYVQDRPETVEFVPADSVGEGLTLDVLHAHAMRNLERRLAECAQWSSIDLESPVEGLGRVRGLVFTGDYFAAEAILSEVIMRQAHERLSAEHLIAIVPQRGELFVTGVERIDRAPDKETLAFIHCALVRHFNPEQAPIAPDVFLLRDARIGGRLDGLEAVVASAREAAQSAASEEQSAFVHRASLDQSPGGGALRIAIECGDVEGLNPNLQHVVRGYAQAAAQDARFTGAIEVVVTITDPTCDAEARARVDADLGSVAQFLQNQLASLHITSQSGGAVTVACALAQ